MPISVKGFTLSTNHNQSYVLPPALNISYIRELMKIRWKKLLKIVIT